tara:strand:- start:1095 stop:1322 length:228 start_codon:yes stop_codon:yes gene_type:complete
MEKRSEKESKINSLSDNDSQAIEVLINKLHQIKESSEISEDSVMNMESVVFDILNMSSRHQKLLLRWVKQGYILD